MALRQRIRQFICLISVLVFCFAANSTFALEQLQNPDFTNGTTGWSTNTRINGYGGVIGIGALNSTISANNSNVTIVGDKNSNTARAIDGLVYQSFRTPANAVNVKFSWGNWSLAIVNSGNGNSTISGTLAQIMYGTSGNDANYTNGALLSNTGGQTANTTVNTTAGSRTLRLNTNTTYYAKIYAYASMQRKKYTMSVDKLSVNFSPSNLRAEVNTIANVINDSRVMPATGVTLSWAASTGNATLKQYNIYRSTTSGSGYTLVGTTTGTTYNDIPTVGGNLYYVVTDVDTDNVESPYSIEASAYYLPPVTNLTGSVLTDGWVRVSLTWTQPSNYTGSAKVYRSETQGGPYTFMNWGGGTAANPYTEQGLTEGRAYYYIVTYPDYTINAHAPISNELKLVYILPPTNFKAGIGVNPTNDSTEATLSWDRKNLAGLQGYKIYRSTTENGTYSLVATIPNGTTSYTDPNLTAGTTYYYRLTCYTAAGESGYTQIRAAKNPINLSGQLVGGGVRLQWTAPNPQNNNHGGYQVFYGTSKTNLTKLVDWHGETTYTHNITIADGDSYYYVVKEMGYDHESGYSNFVKVGSIAPPTQLTAEMAITLNWRASTTNQAKVAGYNVYRSETAGGPYTSVATLGKVTTYNDTTAQCDITYYYVVTTRNAQGAESEYSNEVTFKIPKPDAPTLAGELTENGVELSWNNITYAYPAYFGSYKVYRSTSPDSGYTLIQTLTSPTNSYIDTTSLTNSSYYYVVTACSTLGHESDYSNKVEIKVPTLPTPTLSGVQDGTEVLLTWPAVDYVSTYFSGYKLYRSEVSSSDYTLIATLNSSTLSYSDADVETDHTYYYVLTCTNTLGSESPYSNEVSISMTSGITLSVSLDSSVSPELVLTTSDIANIPVNWTITSKLPDLTITSYNVTIAKSDGTDVKTDTETNTSALTHTVNNVLLRNNEYYIAKVEVFYNYKGENLSSVFYSDNMLHAITPATLNIRDGWSGKDITYSYLDNRAEANWDIPSDSSAVYYEIAVGTDPYSNNVFGWQNIGIVDRYAVTGLELASGTKYYTSIRGVSQQKNIVVTGCSDGFTARRSPVDTDTDAAQHFNNARVLENLDTAGGCLTPTKLSNGGTGYWRYCKPVTITEPGVTDRVNAPCRIQFAATGCNNVREYRVTDDQGRECPRYNISNTANSPNIVFLVNMKKGETKTYYVYWGNTAATEPNYGFVDYTNKNSSNAWTQFYTRKDMPAGLDEESRNANTLIQRNENNDDAVATYNLRNHLTKFKFFGTDRNANWYICTNGWLGVTNITNWQYNATNRFDEFVGNANGRDYNDYRRENITRYNIGANIAPLWCDLQVGEKWNQTGVFRDNLTNPKRIAFTWITYRWSVPDDAYKFQAVLYETGDIAIRYNLLNPRALVAGGAYDVAINTTQNTAGISNGANNTSGTTAGRNNIYYLYHTPLSIGINQSPTAFYQCRDAFEDTTTYGTTTNTGEVAHFESMVFDTRMSSPKWDRMEYDVTVSGNCRINISYRTGNTPLPEMGGWTNWTGAKDVTTSGNTAITTTGRYIQYKAVFTRTGNNGNMTLDEVRFIHGGISIETVDAKRDGETITEVSQGEKDIPVTVTIKNLYAQPVRLTTANMTFTLGGHTAVMTSTLPATIGIAPNDIATLTFNVSIADDAPTGECTLDAVATATYNALTFSDDGAQYPHIWTVKSKATLKIDKVFSTKTEVTKGQSGLPLSVYISNTGEADCILEYVYPNWQVGIYTLTYIGPATGTTVIPGKGSIVATFSVSISARSESGSDTIGATASATNILSGELVEITSTEIPHIWIIQNPASLVLTEVIASSTVYRGQKNNAVILRAQNQGEAEMIWYANESEILFSPHIGSYENIRKDSGEDYINLVSNEMADTTYMVDIKADTATGTDNIDGNIYGIEINTLNEEEYTDGALVPGQWTIYAEKVNTYKDANHTNETNSYNKPEGSNKVIIYCMAENLSYTEEYRFHWYDPDGVEFIETEPRSTDMGNALYYEYEIDSSSKSGVYTITVTNPLNTVVCCQNTFEIVAPASMVASFTLPTSVTVGQNFTASFTYINEGGAVIESATLGVPVTTSGTGRATLIPAADGTEFSPKYSDVTGYGQATATYNFTAASAGTFQLSNTATGFDANSGKTLTVTNVNSNICNIQTPPNITITLNALPTANVFLNQKNLIITATIRNSGQATAIIETASLTSLIGTYNQELTSQTLPFELAANETKTLTFNIEVDSNSATGLDTLKIESVWHDKNWPESGQTKSESNTRQWTINSVGITLSSDDNFDTIQSDFSRGQTVNVKAYGLTPNTQYYRIRFYNTKINQQANVPTGYIADNQGCSGLLAADANGYVFHQYTLPANAKIGDWSVTIESCGTSATTEATTRGAMLGLQYFRVLNAPSLRATLTIDDSEEIFVGDTFKVTMSVTNPTADSADVRDIFPYNLIQSGTAGSAVLITGPEPATFTVRAGETKNFEYTFKAITDTGNTANANNRFKLTTATYAAEGINSNAWTAVYAPVVVSNGLIIYSEEIDVTPNPVDFGHTVSYDDYGHMVCGESFVKSDFTVLKIGNYPAKNIRLNSADFNGPTVDGIMARISKVYFSINPEVVPVLNTDTLIPATLQIPYNQAPGEYNTNMFVYSDANDNKVFDTGEITANFKARVSVDKCWLIKATEEEINMGAWPKGDKGTITDDFAVTFFNAGNQPLSQVKILQNPEVIRISPSSGTSELSFTVSETTIGPMAVGEYHTVQIHADTTTENVSGVYVVSFAIWDDINNNGFINPKPEGYVVDSPEKVVEFESDTVQIIRMIITIGDIGFTLSPSAIHAYNVPSSSTAVSGTFPGFENLTITNNGELSLTRLKLQLGDGSSGAFLSEDGEHSIPPDSVIITPNTLKEEINIGESDVFSISAYSPANTYSATYTADLFIYSDDNNDGIMNDREFRQKVDFSLYTSITKKIQVSQKTVTLGGINAGGTKIQTFSCRNTGNVKLENLYIRFQNLVHQTDNTHVIESGYLSMYPKDEKWFASGEPGEFFYPDIMLDIPESAVDGVYITSMDCEIFEDENKNGVRDEGEVYDTFKIQIEIGDLLIDVLQDEVKTQGESGTKSDAVAFDVKNIGSLDVVNVVASTTTLVSTSGNPDIPSSSSVFTPVSISTLVGGQIKQLNWAVNVPSGQEAGTYTCTITVWGDGDRNGKYDEGEAIDTLEGTLVVEETIRIDVTADTLEIGETLSNLSSVSGSIEIKNTGNVAISATTGTVKTVQQNLVGGSGIIEAEKITAQLQSSSIDLNGSILATYTVSMGTEIIPSGTYSGKQKVYVDINNNNQWDEDEPYDEFTLKVTVGERILVLNPNPLDFGHVSVGELKDATVKAINEGTANIKRLIAKCEKKCDCGCSDTTITLTSPINSVTLKAGDPTPRDFNFSLSVGNTTVGQHTEIWRFIDDDNENGRWDEANNEYSVQYTITYYIDPLIFLEITPSVASITMLQGEVATMAFIVTNKGNVDVDLQNCKWNFPSVLTDVTSMNELSGSVFDYVTTPINVLAKGESATYEISITIPENQTPGTFGPGAQILEYNPPAGSDYKAASFIVPTTIVVNKSKKDIIVPSSTVHQPIDPSVFTQNATDTTYFLSAWVSPGYDTNNPCSANLSVVRYNAEGIPIAAATVMLDNQSRNPTILKSTDNSIFGKDYPDAIPNSKLDYVSVGNPCGIIGNPVLARDESAIDESKRYLKFYRLYLAFKVPSELGSDTIRILLSQSTDPTYDYTASTTVYFDGIKLEKAVLPNQDRPTTYHQGTTLISPSQQIDISGKHRYYEW